MKKHEVNQRIKLLREHLNLTQQDFVAKCGLTNTSLSRIENNQTEPQKGTLKKIIDNTGVSQSWLLEGKGELTIKEEIKDNTTATGSIYKDALYVELKQQATIWQEKYNDLFQMFSKVLDRSSNLGKHKFLALSGAQKAQSRTMIN
ncbi:MAG: helix-turn-helix transcriptional regulator [Bacteroidota bacterium]